MPAPYRMSSGYLYTSASSWLEDARVACGSYLENQSSVQGLMDLAETWVKEQAWSEFDAVLAAWDAMVPAPNPRSDLRLKVVRLFMAMRIACVDHDDGDLTLHQRQPIWAAQLPGSIWHQDGALIARAALREPARNRVLAALTPLVTSHTRRAAFRELLWEAKNPSEAFRGLRVLHAYLTPHASLVRQTVRAALERSVLDGSLNWSPEAVADTFQELWAAHPQEVLQELQAQRKGKRMRLIRPAFLEFCDPWLAHAPLEQQRAWIDHDRAHLPQTVARLRQAQLAERDPPPTPHRRRLRA